MLSNTGLQDLLFANPVLKRKYFSSALVTRAVLRLELCHLCLVC